ncbi:Ras- protein Rab-37 [Balamuthia mandrillaris]
MLSRWRRSRKSAGKEVDNGAFRQAVTKPKPKPQVFLVVVLGGCAPGKTCLCERFVRGEFIAGYSDVGRNLWHKTYKDQLFRLLTTAGHDRFLPIIRSYYPRAAAVVIVYEVTDHRTFDCAKERWNDYKANTITLNGATVENSTPVPVMLFLVSSVLSLRSEEKAEAKNNAGEEDKEKQLLLTARENVFVEACYLSSTNALPIQDLSEILRDSKAEEIARLH